MSRCLLRKTKLDEFVRWLDSQGIPHRPGRGAYEVLQVQAKAPQWFCIYSRHHMPEHFTVDRRLETTVHRFIRESK